MSIFLFLALAGMSLAFVTESLEVCQYAIRMASEAESHMTSVERVLNYTNIESEPGYSTDTAPDESWPTVGSLTLHDLSLAYFKDAPAVLRRINIDVTAKEKVGVVGRTGAGKSSLVAALFRMPEPEGRVSNVRFRCRCYLILVLCYHGCKTLLKSTKTTTHIVHCTAAKTTIHIIQCTAVREPASSAK